jgi:hypothetical protein
VRRVRAPGPMAALVVFVVTMVGMAVAPTWAYALPVRIWMCSASEERH